MKINAATPYAAAYLLVKKGDKIAFLLRKNTGWMDGCYTLAAGKVEPGERYSAAAVREAKEELGVVVKEKDLKYIHTTHRYEKDADTYWADVFFEATKWEGEVHNAEPDVHSELTWFDLDNLPKNITTMVGSLNAINEGKMYSEIGWE